MILALNHLQLLSGNKTKFSLRLRLRLKLKVKMRRFLFLIFLSFILSAISYSQDEKPSIVKSEKTEFINGKKFFLHTVEKGQTLSQIAKAYSITVDDILQVNPEAKKSIKPKQTLLIPAYNKVVEEFAKTENFNFHKIEKGETVSSIAKKYGVKESELLAENPDAKKKIKAGDVLKIPIKDKTKPSTQKAESSISSEIQTHEVESGETLYGIAKENGVTVDDLKKINPDLKNEIKEGQIINIPIVAKNSEVEKIQTKVVKKTKTPLPKTSTDKDTTNKTITSKPLFKNTYNVALMVPLYLSDMDEIKITDNSEDNNTTNYTSFKFIGFYEGALIALDSLKKTGLNVKLFVYEVNDDTSNVRNILKKSEFQNMDLVIGPFFESALKIVTSHAKRSGFKVVSPISPDNKILENNPNIFKAIPSIQVKMEQYTNYIAKKYSKSNIIVIYNDNNEGEKLMFKNFKSNFYNNFDSLHKNIKLKEIPYNKKGLSGIDAALMRDTINSVVVLSNNQIFVSSLVNDFCKRYEKDKPTSGKKDKDEQPEFTSRIEDYNIKMFGLESWRHFDNLESAYLVKLNLHLFSSKFTDFDDDNTKEFIRKYRERFKTEPDNFAFHGFDLCYYFVKALKENGTNFQVNINTLKTKTLQTSYNFKHSGNNGFENKYVNIFKYEEFKLVKVQ